MDAAQLVTGHVVAQAVEVTGAQAPGLGEQLATQRALAEAGHGELDGTRCHHHLGRAGTDRGGARQAQQVAALDLEGAEHQHASAVRRDAVRGRHALAGAQRPDRDAGDAARAHRVAEADGR